MKTRCSALMRFRFPESYCVSHRAHVLAGGWSALSDGGLSSPHQGHRTVLASAIAENERTEYHSGITATRTQEYMENMAVRHN